MEGRAVRSLIDTTARLVVVAALLVLCGAVAHAASIVHIKDGNVWIASPDGAIQRPVTVDGTPGAPYYSPSQADDGTILVGRGSRLYRMNNTGSIVGPPIPTLLTDKPPNMYAVGPFGPRISPDGATVGYWVGFMSGSYDPGCDCILVSPMESAVFARSDGSGPIGFGRFWRSPSWIGNGYALLFAPDNRQTPQVGIADLAALGTEQGWFNDDGTGFDGYWQNLDEGELDRGGHKLALVRGMQAERLSLYVVNDFTTPPELACEFGFPTGAFAGPSWAPDGNALAWSEGDGVWVSPVAADLTAPDACATLNPHLTFAGASEPRWGLADVAPVAPTTTTTTLPSGEGCTSSCDDGDPCTDDLCVQQLCTNVPMMGYDSAICEVGELVRKPLCGEEVLPSKYQRQTAEKVQKTQRWLRKAAASGKPRQVGKLLLRVDRALRAIETKAGKLARRGRLSGDCDQTIKRLVDERRQLVVGLAT